MNTRRLAAAAVVAAALLAGCKPGVRGVITFVGDSNIAGGASQIINNFDTRDNGYVEYMLATSGTTIRYNDCSASLPSGTSCTTNNFWKIRLGQALPRVRSDVIVVELGINDAPGLGDPNGPGYANYDAKIDWMMNLLGSGPVVWTNLPCSIEPTAYQAGCAVIDTALAAAPARHAKLHILDWASQALGRSDWMQPGGVHYTDAGYNAYADYVRSYLDSILPDPPDDPTTSTSTATSTTTSTSTSTTTTTTAPGP